MPCGIEFVVCCFWPCQLFVLGVLCRSGVTDLAEGATAFDISNVAENDPSRKIAICYESIWTAATCRPSGTVCGMGVGLVVYEGAAGFTSLRKCAGATKCACA